MIFIFDCILFKRMLKISSTILLDWKQFRDPLLSNLMYSDDVIVSLRFIIKLVSFKIIRNDFDAFDQELISSFLKK